MTRFLGRHFACGFALALVLTTTIRADDVVTITSASAPDGKLRIPGTIIDYTGREIVVELASGKQQKYPASHVLEVETTYTPQQIEGDKLFNEGQYAGALVKYREAGGGNHENRRWIRRMMLARMVECQQSLGQQAQAGDFFLLLLKDDPQTLYFASIPLPWLPIEMTPALEQKAQQWMATEGQTTDAQKPAVLLGASYLLLTSRQSQALAALKQLASEKDSRLSPLAEAQSWRATIASAPPEHLTHWARRIETFSAELRAGPYFIVGRAWSHRGEEERAALALMHVPILYPGQRPLAAESLWLAGQVLDKHGDAAEAIQLYRELAASYPEARSAALARTELENTARNQRRD
jgi:tetratricopeptide (TPR) repeat protein